jgi:hypothetical protein
MKCRGAAAGVRKTEEARERITFRWVRLKPKCTTVQDGFPLNLILAD